MSVYIKGMEKPSDCVNCIFCYDDECLMHKPNEYRSWPEEYKNCPLVPVPEHGRLIDADALMENAQYKGTHDIVTAWDIVAAPTIIPASKEEQDANA